MKLNIKKSDIPIVKGNIAEYCENWNKINKMIKDMKENLLTIESKVKNREILIEIDNDIETMENLAMVLWEVSGFEDRILQQLKEDRILEQLKENIKGNFN